jgi:hypothetical protein
VTNDKVVKGFSQSCTAKWIVEGFLGIYTPSLKSHYRGVQLRDTILEYHIWKKKLLTFALKRTYSRAFLIYISSIYIYIYIY